MKPEVKELLDLYRDTQPTNHIIFKGLDQLRAMIADPTFKPKTIPKSMFKKEVQAGE